MYSSTFIFFSRTKTSDEVLALEDALAKAARSIPGYLGEEEWTNHGTGSASRVYYWDTLIALQALMEHPDRLIAKAREARWLDGYRVVIAEIKKEYGEVGRGLTFASDFIR